MRTPSLYKFLITICILCLLQSCYSVRIVSTKGAPRMADDFDDDTMDRAFVTGTFDTIVKAGVTTDVSTFRVLKKDCETGRLFSVEYKNTFGGSLLYLVTFGNKRKVRIKYVCMKPEN